MVCIYCSGETQVINSRPQKKKNNIWRRRQCISCNTVFSTIEAANASLSITVRKNNHLEPFLRDHLFVSVYDSLKHRKSALADATSLTDTMLATIYQLADRSVIERDVIVTICATVLERFDTVAVTHYRAFHPMN